MLNRFLCWLGFHDLRTEWHSDINDGITYEWPHRSHCERPDCDYIIEHDSVEVYNLSTD